MYYICSFTVFSFFVFISYDSESWLTILTGLANEQLLTKTYLNFVSINAHV